WRGLGLDGRGRGLDDRRRRLNDRRRLIGRRGDSQRSNDQGGRGHDARGDSPQEGHTQRSPDSRNGSIQTSSEKSGAQRRDIQVADTLAIATPHTHVAEPGPGSRDDLRMIELLRKASSPIAVTLTLALGLVPLDRAHASEPGFAEPPPPQPEGVDESSGQPLRIVADEPPAPALELEPAPAYQPAPEIRTVDSPRPRPGTGLIALGAIGMGASAAMMITGLAGPGWANLERQQAAIIGGMSLPIGLASMAMVVGGS